MGTNEHLIQAATVDGYDALELISRAGRVRATVVPELAMLVWSFRVDGREFLGHPAGVAGFAERWATTGVPLLYPWANRLADDTVLGVSQSELRRSWLVPRDDRGLPIHGLNLSGLAWHVQPPSADADGATVTATAEVAAGPEFALHPVPHRISVTVTLRGDELSVGTTLENPGPGRLPVAFGWHPYLQIPEVPRAEWEVTMPVVRQAELDEQMIPTGRVAAVTIRPGRLGRRVYDHLFPDVAPGAVFSVAGATGRVDVAFGEGYPHAQVYAPADADLIAFEPMTAPTNAMATGARLPWVAPGDVFTAVFTVRARTSLST